MSGREGGRRQGVLRRLWVCDVTKSLHRYAEKMIEVFRRVLRDSHVVMVYLDNFAAGSSLKRTNYFKVNGTT